MTHEKSSYLQGVFWHFVRGTWHHRMMIISISQTNPSQLDTVYNRLKQYKNTGKSLHLSTRYFSELLSILRKFISSTEISVKTIQCTVLDIAWLCNFYDWNALKGLHSSNKLHLFALSYTCNILLKLIACYLNSYHRLRFGRCSSLQSSYLEAVLA